MTANGTRLSW